jgi:tetratricopeptide (TPR) repeat protein
MMIRPKTKRRVLILLASTAAVSGAIGVFVFERTRAINAQIAQARVDGIAAFNGGDYPAVLKKLGFYNTKRKEDPETTLDYAIALTKVPTIDGGNITEAIQAFRRYRSLKPSDIDAEHLLLKTYEQSASYAGPAISLADEILASNPNDLDALETLADVNYAERKWAAALDPATQYTALNPTNLKMQGMTLSVMKEVGKSSKEMHDRADAIAAKNPGDPRSLVVQAIAFRMSIQPTDTSDVVQANLENERKLLLQACQQDPPDAQFVTITVNLLDQLRQFSASQSLLDKATAKINDPLLLRQLVARLWQNEKNAEVLSKLANIDPMKADANLVAYKALAYHGLDKKPEADALVAALTARNEEPLAYALSHGLTTFFNADALDPKTQVTQYEDALQHDPHSSIIEFMLGEAYSRMGETDLALEEWRTVSAQVPSWATPHQRIATLLANTGHGDEQEALLNAEDAASASQDENGDLSSASVITDAMIKFARLQVSNDPRDAQSLLEEVSEIQSKMPGEPNTLPVYVALLDASQQRDKAIEVIKAAMKQTGENGETLLLNLAQRSKVDKLGMEPALYQAIKDQYGMTPRLASTLAGDLLEAGQAAKGLQFLKDNKPKESTDLALWDRAICLYMEQSHNPDAAKAWKALGDGYPTDILTQSVILNNESSAWADREFIDRTIQRLQQLTGDQAVGWKLARARWLVDSPDTQRDTTAAIVLLSDVIKTSPGEYKPHVLLAEAFEKLGAAAFAKGDVLDGKNKNVEAVSEWRQAADLLPNSPPLLYHLMVALHNTGNIDEVRATFNKIASIQHLPPDLATLSATYIAADGQPQLAEKMLVAYPVCNIQVLHDSTLAKIYRLEGRVNEAVSKYFELAKEPNLDVTTIREASDFFGSQHDSVAAHKFLDRLNDMQLPAGTAKLVNAEYDETYGDVNTAAQEYTAAVQQAGNDPTASVQQIGFLIRQKQWDQAQAMLAGSLQRWPDNTDLLGLKNLAATLSGGQTALAASQSPALTSLMNEVSKHPQNQAANDTLRVMVAAPSAGSAATMKSLQDLLAKYPGFQPLYSLTVQQYLNMKQMGDAVALASQAMSQFPDSPDAARIAAGVFATVNRWSDALDAAEKWRARGAEHPQDADLMIATADLFVDQPRDAVDRLSVYIPDAKSTPDANVNLLLTYAEALCRANQEEDAAKLLLPLAQNSADWRVNWLKMAVFAHKDGASAAAWIERVRPLLAKDSLPEQQHLADAYFECALKLNYPQGYALAEEALKPFVGTPAMTPAALMTFASAADQANDLPAAEDAYRQVLKLTPGEPIVLNNLASLLGKKGDPASLTEGEALARQAVAAHPSAPETSNYYDTLARILEKQGRNDDALSTFETGNSLNPNDLNVLIGLANLSAKINHIDAATRYLARIDSIMPPGMKIPDDVRTELDSARDMVKKANAITGVNP